MQTQYKPCKITPKGYSTTAKFTGWSMDAVKSFKTHWLWKRKNPTLCNTFTYLKFSRVFWVHWNITDSLLIQFLYYLVNCAEASWLTKSGRCSALWITCIFVFIITCSQFKTRCNFLLEIWPVPTIMACLTYVSIQCIVINLLLHTIVLILSHDKLSSSSKSFTFSSQH